MVFFFFFQAEDGIRDGHVTGVQTCALPIYGRAEGGPRDAHVDDAYGRPPRWTSFRDLPDPGPLPGHEPQGWEGREAEDAGALYAAALERNVADVDREPLVARFGAVGLVGFVYVADGPEARERQQRRRAGTHHDVNPPHVGRLVDGCA